MKKAIAFIMATFCFLGSFTFVAFAVENGNDEIQASGLIYMYNLYISKKNNTTLRIEGVTDCDPVVVKCGFKNLKVQRRANSSSSWTDYHDYGNDYLDTSLYEMDRDLSVDAGYQYRVTCKHYAKKNILNTQSISNTSNIVTF